MSDSRPNILLVVMDTARVRAFSSVDFANTPVIQSLKENGYSYSQTITTAPWTLPSHASLFTGTYVSKHGAHADHKRLDDDLAVLAEVLRENGYETAAVSNNTWISEEFGFGRGFETFLKSWQYLQTGTDFADIARNTQRVDRLKAVSRRIFEGNPLVNLTNALYGKYFRRRKDSGAKHSNSLVDEWLKERRGDRPFFLFVNYLEPHLEYRPSPEYAKKFLPEHVSYEEAKEVNQNAWKYIAGKVGMTEKDFDILRALYLGEIAYLDERIGDLRESLECAGEWENTVILVTGDHGENIGDHGLMDHQYCLYDTLLHVPLVIQGDVFSGGETIDDLVQLVDIAPTMLDVARIEGSELREQSQGYSLHPDADKDTRRYAFAEYMAPNPTMEALETRVGELQAEVYEYDRSLRTVRTEEWKLIRGSDGNHELYHVATDPDESENVLDTEPNVAEELGTELDSWLRSFEHAEHSGSVTMREETKRRLENLGYLQ